MPGPKSSKKIAIITGASSGLGFEFARQIEKNYFLDEIWLIARRAAPMKELATSFHKSKGVILPLNITDQGDLATLKKKIADEGPDIHYLVNNAGSGKIGPFAEMGLEEQLEMVDLNIRSLTHLTHMVIPYMMPGAQIVQVASSIGFCPAPHFAVYAATKAYVISLSEALSYELRDRGINVIAVCPGPVATEFFSLAQKNEFMKDRVGEAEPVNKALRASAESVVQQALTDADKGRRRSVFSLPIKAFVNLVPFLPRSFALRAMAQRQRKKAGKTI